MPDADLLDDDLAIEDADEDADDPNDDDLDDPALDEAEPDKPKAKPKTKPAPAAATPPAAENQNALAELGLAALKSAWAEQAKAAGATAADFDGIGLKGVDDTAKEAFLAEATASHEKRVAELEAQGFVYQPGKSDVEQREAALQAAWGAPGPGGGSIPEDDKLRGQISDEVKSGDTRAVIGTLLAKGGMGEFFIKGRRSA